MGKDNCSHTLQNVACNFSELFCTVREHVIQCLGFHVGASFALLLKLTTDCYCFTDVNYIC